MTIKKNLQMKNITSVGGNPSASGSITTGEQKCVLIALCSSMVVTRLPSLEKMQRKHNNRNRYSKVRVYSMWLQDRVFGNLQNTLQDQVSLVQTWQTSFT